VVFVVVVAMVLAAERSLFAVTTDDESPQPSKTNHFKSKDDNNNNKVHVGLESQILEESGGQQTEFTGVSPVNPFAKFSKGGLLVSLNNNTNACPSTATDHSRRLSVKSAAPPRTPLTLNQVSQFKQTSAQFCQLQQQLELEHQQQQQQPHHNFTQSDLANNNNLTQNNPHSFLPPQAPPNENLFQRTDSQNDHINRRPDASSMGSSLLSKFASSMSQQPQTPVHKTPMAPVWNNPYSTQFQVQSQYQSQFGTFDNNTNNNPQRVLNAIIEYSIFFRCDVYLALKYAIYLRKSIENKLWALSTLQSFANTSSNCRCLDISCQPQNISTTTLPTRTKGIAVRYKCPSC
jgi:hypothetical protein